MHAEQTAQRALVLRSDWHEQMVQRGLVLSTDESRPHSNKLRHKVLSVIRSLKKLSERSKKISF